VLTVEGLAVRAIARRLKEEGYRPLRDGAHFGPQGITAIQQRLVQFHSE
jgi:hypothetical protein